MNQTRPACRLYAIIARDGRSAVVLRRGPTRQVQLIRWWLNSDTFEEGQWFKGRIYEMRCDLSPSGEKFTYFAQDLGRSAGSWTAISNPPYLTAVVMWAKGDCWGGGALFESETKVLLNHHPGAENNIYQGFKLPRHITVDPLGAHSGQGEDDPINHYRLIRDGWRWAQQGHSSNAKFGAEISYPYDPVGIYAKPHPGKGPIDLLQITRGVGVKNGPWYKTDHAIVKPEVFTESRTLEVTDIQESALLYLEGSSWADWASNGDLLYAEGGSLFRLKRKKGGRLAQSWQTKPVELADFSANTFNPLPPTERAQRW